MKRLAQQTLVIGSGKGGVGKSTVSVNIAVALARLGLQVGLLDADLYGPSIPIMFGLRMLTPATTKDQQGKEWTLPFTKYGVKTLSLGYFIEESRSVVWRGPVLHTTLQKMLFETDWGELDVLLIDLPPGTGDVPMSLSQLITIDGALVVTTPQDVAILDAVKAINSFHQLEIPLCGIIENMAGFTAPGTEEVYYLFGEGQGHDLAERFQAPLIGSIPILPAICLGCEEGCPVAFHQGSGGVGEVFMELASNLLQQVRYDEHVGRNLI
ncbi:MAG: Mrp/NBP35 family ATP-binding protein [Chlamydiota bacterium]